MCMEFTDSGQYNYCKYQRAAGQPVDKVDDLILKILVICTMFI